MEEFLLILKNSLNMDPDEGLSLAADLAGLDGWDSLGKFMLVSAIYSEYGVVVEPDAVNAALTASDLWRLVEARKGN